MLECAPNFRDLGGLAATDGRRVKRGAVFRSEAILHPTGADELYLQKIGIGVVVDLRSASEARADSNIFFRGSRAELLQLDIGTDVRAKGSFWDELRSDSSPTAVRNLLHRIYRSLPLAVAPALEIIFERLESGAPPMLIHCAVGKDRTGVAVALLLHALGVPMDLIMEDYLETQKRLTPSSLAQSAATLSSISNDSLPAESLGLLTGVRRDFLEQSFSWMDRKYGGPDGFLQARTGLTSKRRDAIRNTLLERNSA